MGTSQNSKYMLEKKKDLTRKIKHKNYQVFCDNFYTSFSLFSDILADGLYACGTVRTHCKGFPNDLKEYILYNKLERGESITLQCINQTNMITTVWEDTKLVSATSTNAQPLPHNEVTRQMKTGEKRKLPCPQNITIYNQYMGGVDRNDQLWQYYHIKLKCRKYYKYIFWFLMDVGITNCFILAKEYTDLSLKHVKDFHLQLAKELIGDFNGRKRCGRKSLSQPAKKFITSHFPLNIDGKQHIYI